MANENLEGQLRFKEGLETSGQISDDEESFSFRSRRTSTATEMSYTNEDISSEDDTIYNILTGEEQFDWLDFKFLDFKTRRSRCPKKNKNKESYLAHRPPRERANKPVMQPEMEEDFLIAYDGDAIMDSQRKPESNKRKRSFNQLRSIERDAKFDVSGTSTSDVANILPQMPTQTSMKIGTTNHFRSLNSKLLAPKELEETNAPSDGTHAPCRQTPVESCRRIEFYSTFSMLIRMGNSEPKCKEEHNFIRQRSHEEQLWQNKLNDLLWLELRALHNGRSVQLEDQAVFCERERIGTVLNEIMNFKFISSTNGNTRQWGNDSHSSNSHPNFVNKDAEKSDSCIVICDTRETSTPLHEQTSEDSMPKRKLGLLIQKADFILQQNLADHVNGRDELLPDFNPGCDCLGFCNIFCQHYINNQNDALKQVKCLLDKLDNVEALYPSSRAMKKEWEYYTLPQLESRIRTLCLYYNLAMDLRQKISTLGKMLFSLGGKHLKWPNFNSTFELPDESESDGVGVSHPPADVNMTTSKHSEVFSQENDVGGNEVINVHERKLSKSVRFENVEVFELNSSLESAKCSLNSTPYDSPDSTPTSGSIFNFSSPIHNHSFKDSSRRSVTSPYRRFVDKFLKQKGLRKLLQRLMDVLQNTLCRAKFALEKRPDFKTTNSPGLPCIIEEPVRLKPYSTKSDHCCKKADEWAEELACYGAWSEDYRSMELPSFRSLYLFLLGIPLDIMHECLRLRLEKQPEVPSNLSIRQLMRECKEAIKAAVLLRQKFIHMSRAVLMKYELDKVEQDLSDYDDSVKKMFQSYLRYLQSWVQMLLKSVQQNQKNVLEEEWTFVKVFSCYIQRGEALASETFCSMASNILDSTGHFLETHLDDCTSVHDSRMLSDSDISSSTRHNILQSCRDFKEVFQETRKRALKAVAFAKMLRKDLEIAAEFEIKTSVQDLLQKLKSSGHIRLIAPHSSSFVVFIPGHIQNNQPYLWQLLSMTYGHEHSAAPNNVESEGYLVILCCEDCGCLPELWSGLSLVIEPTAEITITLSHLKVEGLLLVVNHSSQLGLQRKAFQAALGDTVMVTKEFTSCNQSIANSLMDLKKEAFCLRDKIKDAVCLVEERLDMNSISDLDEFEKLNLQARCREILHQCYNFGFEYHKEMTRLVTGEARTKLGHGLIEFAKQWMNFVAQKCERGRGVRPRWANKGLDFLMTACEPIYLVQLTDEEFFSLKQAMNGCITHLIGSLDSRPNNSLLSVSRSHSPTPRIRPSKIHHSASYSGETFSSYPRSVSTISSKSEPVSTNNLLVPISPEQTVQVLAEPNYFQERRKSFDGTEIEENLARLEMQNELPVERIQNAVQLLELDREQKLRESNVIGRVIEKSTDTSFVQISARKVTFHWQKGIKIGQGRFGKVYTAVNNDTGDLMALKEMHLQPNDHKTIKEIADELKIFEGIRHKYLVRYYGVEIHRDEMYIFMEYCDCGTLENAAQLGLPEPLIRKYTRQLLEATSVLHEHGIVHRDIKGANIFLTSDGNLKLGDFGCCIKLKNHSTMPGELNAFVGTQAFMAPEVFTKPGNEGHGRAADIWSIGCVVVEMATGFRPWPELESNYQIMFKVGTGETPDIPKDLSLEGMDFLTHCFKFEPKERWTAIMLLDHPFTKVDSEEEFQSITIFPDIHQY